MLTREALQGVQTAHKASLDAVYTERNLVLALAAKLAATHPMSYAYRTLDEHTPEDDPWRWIVVVILSDRFDAAPRQLTWHIHENELPLFESLVVLPNSWDGHTTAEKYEHLRRWVAK